MARSTPAMPAMTPEEALRTVTSVRQYREQLTGRAAGIVWMVWGIVITLTFYAGLFVDLDGDADRSTGEREILHYIGAAGMALAIAAGAVVTNAVWQAHALESGGRHPRWIAFAAGLGLMAAFAVVAGVVIPEGAQALGHPLRYYAPMHLFTALAALALTLLQRRHVRPAIGAMATLGLFVVFVVTFFPLTHDDFGLRIEALLLALVPLVTFMAVGWAYARQG